jgi:hypothetical protein
VMMNCLKYSVMNWFTFCEHYLNEHKKIIPFLTSLAVQCNMFYYEQAEQEPLIVSS